MKYYLVKVNDNGETATIVDEFDNRDDAVLWYYENYDDPQFANLVNPHLVGYMIVPKQDLNFLS